MELSGQGRRAEVGDAGAKAREEWDEGVPVAVPGRAGQGLVVATGLVPSPPSPTALAVPQVVRDSSGNSSNSTSSSSKQGWDVWGMWEVGVGAKASFPPAVAIELVPMPVCLDR